MSLATKASELALVGVWDFLHTLLANLGEDFSSQKKTSGGNANHEKPPLPLGMMLKFATLIAVGVGCSLVFLAVSVSRALRFRCLADPSSVLVFLPRRGAHKNDGFFQQSGRYRGESV